MQQEIERLKITIDIAFEIIFNSWYFCVKIPISRYMIVLQMFSFLRSDFRLTLHQDNVGVPLIPDIEPTATCSSVKLFNLVAITQLSNLSSSK